MANRYATTYTEDDLPDSFVDAVKSAVPKYILFDAELTVAHGDIYELRRAIHGNSDELQLVIFDVLDLKDVILTGRRTWLNDNVKVNDRVKLTDSRLCYTADEIQELFQEYVSKGFEGAVVKPDSFYYATWVKMKRLESVDLVIIGIKKTKSWLSDGLPYTFLLGAFDGSKFVPISHASSGLSLTEKEAIGEFLSEYVVREDRENVYVEPIVVVEVAYQERTKNGLRHPRLVRLRLDKHPEECQMKDL